MEEKYAIMDDNGIIEDGFTSELHAFDNILSVRRENKNIKGDLKIIKICSCHN